MKKLRGLFLVIVALFLSLGMRVDVSARQVSLNMTYLLQDEYGEYNEKCQMTCDVSINTNGDTAELVFEELVYSSLEEKYQLPERIVFKDRKSVV